jgi:hypothetical protein
MPMTADGSDVRQRGNRGKSGSLVKSRKDAAALLGVTPRSLGEWKLRPGFPDCSKGHPIAAIEIWRKNNLHLKTPRMESSIRELTKAVRELIKIVKHHFSRNES